MIFEGQDCEDVSRNNDCSAQFSVCHPEIYFLRQTWKSPWLFNVKTFPLWNTWFLGCMLQVVGYFCVSSFVTLFFVFCLLQNKVLWIGCALSSSLVYIDTSYFLFSRCLVVLDEYFCDWLSLSLSLSCGHPSNVMAGQQSLGCSTFYQLISTWERNSIL